MTRLSSSIIGPQGVWLDNIRSRGVEGAPWPGFGRGLYFPSMTETTPTPSKQAWTRGDLAQDPHELSDKADRVRSMFGAIAPSYDFNNRIHSFGQDQRWRRKGVRLAAPDADSVVVDVACGTGDLSEAFHDAGVARVIGVDFTPEMLDVARARAARAGRERLEYRDGDATALDLPTDSADVLSIAFGIRNVNRPELALAEFRRILKPGGRLLILEFSEPENRLIRGLNALYTRRIMPLTATMLSGDRSGAYRYLPRSIETFLPRAELEARIREAGFENVQQHSLTFGVCVAYLAS